MNRFSIFCLLALFCISFAPAQTASKLEEYRKIKAAKIIDDDPNVDSLTFDKEDVYLYKAFDAEKGLMFYHVGYDPDSVSEGFLMDWRNTFVIKNEIQVGYAEKAITLTVDGDAFAFYKEIFSLDDSNFPSDVRATGIYCGLEKMDVTAVKAIKREDRECIYISLADNEPSLVFPYNRVKAVSMNSDKQVKFILNITTNTGIPVTMNFDNSSAADDFRKLAEDL